MFAGLARGDHLALDAAIAKTAGHEDALHACKGGVHVCFRAGEIIRLYPFDAHAGAVGDACLLYTSRCV